MYEIIKQVILSGAFRLEDIVKKINTVWIESEITEEQRNELIELARENANLMSEMPEVIEMIKSVSERCGKLEERVAKIENQGGEPPIEEEYPAWEPWDGISKKYQKGDKVSHNDKKWESAYDGQNIWEPGSPGIDERYWIEVVEEPGETE